MGEIVKGPGAKDNALGLPERAEDVTPEHIRQALLEMAKFAKSEEVRVEALELLGRSLGMYTDVIIYRVEAAGGAE